MGSPSNCCSVQKRTDRVEHYVAALVVSSPFFRLIAETWWNSTKSPSNPKHIVERWEPPKEEDVENL